METENRNLFIDIIKGLAIFLVLWGHCIQIFVFDSNVDFYENYLFKLIYSFHMPLFMLVSGYLFYYSFSKRNLKELLIHKTQALLQPIIFCTIFNYFLTTVLFGAMKGDFSFAFNGGWVNEFSGLWFLWAVLVFSVTVAIICKTCKNIFLEIILLIVAVPIISIFPNNDQILYVYPYFVSGFYFSKYKDKLPKVVCNLKYVTILLFPILICFYKREHYIYTTGLFPSEKISFAQMLFIDGYRWLIGFVGAICVITVLEIIYIHVTSKTKKPILSNAMSKIGKKSLQVYALSELFLEWLLVFFSKMLTILNIENIFVKNIHVYNFAFTLPIAIAFAFILYCIIIKLLEKLKIAKVMFGN